MQGEGFTSPQGRVNTSAVVPVFPVDTGVQQLVATYHAAAVPLAQRPVGQVTAAILRQPGPSLESPLGNLIADAQLHATRLPGQGGAQISFMNPGGVRADLVPDEQGVARQAAPPAGEPVRARGSHQ